MKTKYLEIIGLWAISLFALISITHVECYIVSAAVTERTYISEQIAIDNANEETTDESEITTTETDETETTVSVIVPDDNNSDSTADLSGWVKDNKGYRYMYSNGEYAVHGMISVNGKKYFIGKDGYRKSGIIKYNNKKYYFQKGQLYTKTNIITYKKNKYYIRKAKVQTGLKKINKKYYYFSKKSGKMIKNKLLKIKGKYYKFDFKGIGIKKTAAEIKAIKLIGRITKKSDSRQIKLKKGFNYMARNYRYAIKPGFVSPNSSGWVETFAYNMFTTKTGRCYSFAAAFCVYARELGYNAKVIVASTLGLTGGYVPHAWVEIKHNGVTYIYDTELANTASNVYAFYKKTYSSMRGRYKK